MGVCPNIEVRAVLSIVQVRTQQLKEAWIVLNRRRRSNLGFSWLRYKTLLLCILCLLIPGTFIVKRLALAKATIEIEQTAHMTICRL